MTMTVGSVCSGIEAASVSWKPLGMQFKWFSEIATFPSKVLAHYYPTVPNLGDMKEIPEKIRKREIEAPDIICAGTPCQAFSYAGWQNGLNDERGNLTLRFVDIIDESDKKRIENNKPRSIVLWENVEGVLSDKTNAFGCFISSLAGIKQEFQQKRWPNAGSIHGTKRNVAWRVLDAKYFGLPQQRRRLYVIATDKNQNPESILFEEKDNEKHEYPLTPLNFTKNGHNYEVFRHYTDCLYSSYGTKWNGNAAANNGSLFVVQDERIRRFSPTECERLMGFPENYTNIPGATRTSRYQAIGNSWAVPVIRWIGERIKEPIENIDRIVKDIKFIKQSKALEDGCYYADMSTLEEKLNTTPIPTNCQYMQLKDIITEDASEKIYISPVGCYGIIRRKNERNLTMNPRLEEILKKIAAEMPHEEIETKSRIQPRGRYSK